MAMVNTDLLIDGGIVSTPFGCVNLSVPVNNGKIILPVMIDTPVHLRELGYTYREGFTTGTQVTDAGGFTMIDDTGKRKTITRD